jgi:histidine triad (HIT) family protein
MATIFSKIISGEIPCYKVAENDDFLAFLDIQPLRIGHVLIIPKLEIDYIFDMDDEHLGKMMAFSKTVAHKIKAVFPCRKVGVTVIGLEVPHAHIHLIPINGIQDMNFSQEKMVLSSAELDEISKALQQA